MGRLSIALLAACSFPHHDLVDLPDTVSLTCGNGVVEAGEECEIGTTSACSTPCGTGTTICRANCTRGTCDVAIPPASAWQMSTNTTSWSPAALPDVAWSCTNCTRYYRTTICGQPTAIDFQWSSDNRARMTVNDTTAFDAFWIASYCTDEPCCTKCCDTNANCLANLSSPQTLDPSALALFTAGSNVMRWEVNQESGGSGFYTTMTVHY